MRVVVSSAWMHSAANMGPDHVNERHQRCRCRTYRTLNRQNEVYKSEGIDLDVMQVRLGAAGRPRSAAGQSLAQRRPLAADPGPYAADHCNDRNEQDAQKHRVFDQSGAILVFAQAADESQSI
jgi:hypothetical protein